MKNARCKWHDPEIFPHLCATALFNFVSNILSQSIYTLYTYLRNMKYPIKYMSLTLYTYEMSFTYKTMKGLGASFPISANI